MKKVIFSWIKSAFDVAYIVVMSALAGTGFAYGCLVGLTVYAALHGS